MTSLALIHDEPAPVPPRPAAPDYWFDVVTMLEAWNLGTPAARDVAFAIADLNRTAAKRGKDGENG